MSASDKKSVAEAFFRSFSYMILSSGTFMCDPHPGNFLIQQSSGGSPGDSKRRRGGCRGIILDFGMSASLDAATRAALGKLFIAIKAESVEAVMAALAEIGVDVADCSDALAESILIFMVHFFRDTSPSHENRQQFQKFIKEAKARRKARESAERATGAPTPFVKNVPVGWVQFTRTYTLLRGVCCQLGARVPVLDILVEAARAAQAQAGGAVSKDSPDAKRRIAMKKKVKKQPVSDAGSVALGREEVVRAGTCSDTRTGRSCRDRTWWLVKVGFVLVVILLAVESVYRNRDLPFELIFSAQRQASRMWEWRGKDDNGRLGVSASA